MKHLSALFASLLLAAPLSAQYWSPLGSGMNGFLVSSIAVENANGNLWVGGNFTQAGGVQARYGARWNGFNWEQLDSGFDNPVRVLKFVGDTLYAGGDFTLASGTNAVCIAYRESSGTWHNMGTGMVKTGQHTAVASVYDIEMYQGSLYVGGVFDYADNVNCNYVARWTGTTWAPLGTGVGGTSWVYAMEVYNNELYIAGNFQSVGGQTCKYIARWNGSTWSPVGSGANGQIYDLAIHNGELYACGAFTQMNGLPANRVAKWDGSNWTAVGAGMNTDVNTLESFNGNLWAGGIFTQAAGQTANRFARWDGTDWTAPTAGMNGLLYVLAADTARNRLYAGGNFTQADGVNASRMAVFSPLVSVDVPAAAAPATVYPQPADDLVILRPGSPGTHLSLQLTDLAGRSLTVQARDIGGEILLERGDLPAGMYLYRIQDGAGSTLAAGRLSFR